MPKTQRRLYRLYFSTPWMPSSMTKTSTQSTSIPQLRTLRRPRRKSDGISYYMGGSQTSGDTHTTDTLAAGPLARKMEPHGRQHWPPHGSNNGLIFGNYETRTGTAEMRPPKNKHATVKQSEKQPCFTRTTRIEWDKTYNGSSGHPCRTESKATSITYEYL